MNTKGQGALEYLLIIGGAVLVAAIVIALISSTTGPVQSRTNQNILDGLCAGPNKADACNGKDPDASTTNTLCNEGDCTLNSVNVCVGKTPVGIGGRTGTCFP